MKQLLLIATFFITVFTSGCRTNKLRGVYTCDQSNKKPDTTIHHENYDEAFMDLTCTLKEIDFKGGSTVTIKIGESQVTSSYVIDNEYVRIKGSGSDILLKIQDQNTLTGEGVSKGVYHKK